MADHPIFSHQRIVVVGTTGSGKTTLAAQLAQHLGCTHIELDALHWEPNWTEAPLDIFRERVAQAIHEDTWTLDGNYSKVRDMVWNRADTIVWLDYPAYVVFSRLLHRTFHRLVTCELLWGTNRESWRTTFMSRDSLMLWALQTYRKRRKDYPRLLAQPEHAHLTVIRLKSPHQTRRWLAQFPPR